MWYRDIHIGNKQNNNLKRKNLYQQEVAGEKKNFFLKVHFLMCIRVSLLVCMCSMCIHVAYGDKKKLLGCLRLEFYMVVICHAMLGIEP